MKSPAISVNGGRLPEEFIAKVRSVLPEELELLDMLTRLKYIPEVKLPYDEERRDKNYQPGHEISEKFLDIMHDMEKECNLDGNLAHYFALKRHDPDAFARLTRVAQLVEGINHLSDELEWVINGDGYTEQVIWSLEESAERLIPANPGSFQSNP